MNEVCNLTALYIFYILFSYYNHISNNNNNNNNNSLYFQRVTHLANKKANLP